MPTRRERLVGFKFRARGGLEAEVRKSCRDELKILYAGGPFSEAVWRRLGELGQLNVLELSKINPKMRDLFQVRAEGLRLEGTRDGELVTAFYVPALRARWRKRVEALIVGA